MSKARTPKVNALVVSLDARRDEPTGRLDLIGVVSTLQVPVLPVEFPGLTVFVSPTNLSGSYRLAMEFLNLADSTRLAGVEQDAPFQRSDPLAVWSEIARLAGPIRITEAGRYACRLLLNGEYLHEVVLDIVRIAPPEPA